MNNWELKLGPLQIIILLGLLVGSLLCVFAFGFYTGRSVGFDMASAKELSSAGEQFALVNLARSKEDDGNSADPASSDTETLSRSAGLAPTISSSSVVGDRGVAGGVPSSLPTATIATSELKSKKDAERRETAMGATSGGSIAATGKLDHSQPKGDIVNPKEASVAVSKATPTSLATPLPQLTATIAPTVTVHTADPNYTPQAVRLELLDETKDAKSGPAAESATRTLGDILRAREEKLVATASAGAGVGAKATPTLSQNQKAKEVVEKGKVQEKSDRLTMKDEEVRHGDVVHLPVLTPTKIVETKAVLPGLKGEKRDGGVEPSRKTVLPSEKPSPKPREEKKGGRWIVQVAAPKNRQDAERIVKDLKSSGYPARVELATVAGHDYYRVVVGNGSSKEGAEETAVRIRQGGRMPSAPFVRLEK